MQKPTLDAFQLNEHDYETYMQVKLWSQDRLLLSTAAATFIFSYGTVFGVLLSRGLPLVVDLGLSMPGAFILTVTLGWIPFLLLRKGMQPFLRWTWPLYGRGARYERALRTYQRLQEQRAGGGSPLPEAHA
jgi:hypothetical protein